MKTNELKKGVRVKLANGWEADLLDNLKGNTRLAKVYGYVVESGSIYSHDILMYRDENNSWQPVEHTPDQNKLRESMKAFGW
jgi:hypothetical protein